MHVCLSQHIYLTSFQISSLIKIHMLLFSMHGFIVNRLSRQLFKICGMFYQLFKISLNIENSSCLEDTNWHPQPNITLNLAFIGDYKSLSYHSCTRIKNLILHVQIFLTVTGGTCSMEKIKEIEDIKTAINKYWPWEVDWTTFPNTKKMSIVFTYLMMFFRNKTIDWATEKKITHLCVFYFYESLINLFVHKWLWISIYMLIDNGLIQILAILYSLTIYMGMQVNQFYDDAHLLRIYLVKEYLNYIVIFCLLVDLHTQKIHTGCTSFQSFQHQIQLALSVLCLHHF